MIGAERIPSTDDKYVGIEIECLYPDTEGVDIDEIYNTIEDKFIDAGLAGYCSLKDDGSICGDDIGIEVAILVKQREVYRIVPRICKVLNDLGCYVNTSCGLHVHLDMRNREAEKCFNNLVLAQPLLYAMQPKSRQNNGYCVPTDLDAFLDGYTERYVGINSQALEKFNTLEVRMHSGTTNANKIVNWVRLLVAIADGRLLREEVSSPSELTLDAKVRSYVYKRMTDVKRVA